MICALEGSAKLAKKKTLSGTLREVELQNAEPEIVPVQQSDDIVNEQTGCGSGFCWENPTQQ